MIYLKLISTMFFWGATFTAAKIAVKDFTPFTAAFYRFLIAASIMVILFKLQKEKSFVPRAFLLSIFSGLTGIFLYNFFFFSGLHMTDAGKASLIVAVNPIFTIMLSALIFKEKLTLKQITGIFIALAGVATIILKGNFTAINTNINTGDILILGAAISWSSYTLIGKKLLKTIQPFDSVTYSTVWGLILLTPFFIKENINHLQIGNSAAWIAILSLSILATVIGFVWFYDGINTIGAAKTASFIHLVPLFGVLTSFVIMNEKITSSTIAGGLIVISGLYIVNKK